MKSLRLARQIRRQKIAEASTAVQASYFGPKAVAGYSYGLYACPDCEFEQISNKGQMIHCVQCGTQAKLKSGISFTAVSKLLAKNATKFACHICGSSTLASAKDARKEVGMFCPQCGSVMENEEYQEDETLNEDLDSLDEDLELEEEDLEGQEDEEIIIED